MFGNISVSEKIFKYIQMDIYTAFDVKKTHTVFLYYRSLKYFILKMYNYGFTQIIYSE